jgi:fructose-1,6-bisphosphatase/sedoheptulose 1,7-bisphosphatase-like protein
MKKIFGILLIVVGLVVFFMGLNRKNSLVGEVSEAGSRVANSVDGGVRTPQHVTYMVVGGVLALVGIGVTASSRSASKL